MSESDSKLKIKNLDKKTKVIKSPSEMKDYIDQTKNKTIGFVPTMGTLHEGHLELVKNSLKVNDITVVSIFVNPMQFNNPKDFETYPNKISLDLQMLEDLNVDAVFTPSKDQIYPKGYDFKMTENKDSIGLCGTARPGHFDGVLTVILKLFNLVKPKNVYMGLKDYQQYLLVKNMVEDLFMDIEIHGIETVREESGLALSSRNVNLTQEQKKIAEDYARIFASDEDLEIIKSKLENLDLKIDYLTERWGRKFVAVFIGEVRLIDNRPYNSVLAKPTLRTESKNILFKMSGSISCYKACDVISKLVQAGHEVKVAVTPDTFNFVGQATLEGLSQNQVICELYNPGQMMDHIHLNDWADITVLCPATANTISKIAMGLSDNIVTSLALARDASKPYIIMPAMNSRMLSASPTQKSLRQIENMGIEILYGNSGHLACGHVGSGRLAEPVDIFNRINLILNQNISSPASLEIQDSDQSLHQNLGQNKIFEKNQIITKKKRILITAGGTSEPIDPVRTVTNISTGQTGLTIAKMFAEKYSSQNSEKYEVTLLGSVSMLNKLESLNSKINFVSYSSFEDLEKNLKNLLISESYEAIVHLAAVSDYSPKALNLKNRTIQLPSLEKISLDDTKITSNKNVNAQDSEGFSIEFKKNKKLISEIRDYSKNKNIKVIGFKLLRIDDIEKIKFEINKVLNSSDYVVVNDLNNISKVKHNYEIYNQSGIVFRGENKNEMSLDILKIIDGGHIL